MSTNITFNGSTYTIPAEGDENWGSNLSNYFIAIASGALQKTGGSFPLSAEVDFGATYGFKLPYLKSRAANPASAGIVRFGNNEGLAWRNAANDGDLALKVNASNLLEYNGNTVLDAGGSGLTDLITNAMVKSDAAIAYSKLAALTASRALVSDSGGVVSVSAVTSTELGYVSGVTSAIQTQLNAKAPTASPTFSGTITTPLTASRALVTGASSELGVSAVTATELGYLSGVTSSVQTQLDAKATSSALTTHASTQSGVHGLAITAAKVLTVQKTITLTSADDTSVITLPAGTKTLLATDGTAAKATAPASGSANGVVILDGSGNFASVAPGTNGNLLQSNGTAWISAAPAISVATNLANGLGGQIPYQSAANTTAMLANGTAGQFLKSQGTTLAPVWSDLPIRSGMVENLGFALSVSGGALTIALKQADGTSDPAAGAGTVKVTIDKGDGSSVVRSITAALSLTVPSTAKLTTKNGVASPIYFYLVDSDDNGAMKLAIASVPYPNGVQTTVQIAGGSNDYSLYSDAVYSGKQAILIGGWISTQATAGTWAATTGTKTVDQTTLHKPAWQAIYAVYKIASADAIGATDGIVNFGTRILDSHNLVTTGVGSWGFSVPFTSVWNVILSMSTRGSEVKTITSKICVSGSVFAAIEQARYAAVGGTLNCSHGAGVNGVSGNAIYSTLAENVDGDTVDASSINTITITRVL